MNIHLFNLINELAIYRAGINADVLKVLEVRLEILSDLQERDPEGSYESAIQSTQEAIAGVQFVTQKQDLIRGSNSETPRNGPQKLDTGVSRPDVDIGDIS
jgi:uncharacterized membrane protein YgaE (UPF0421/DUF939 family)